MHYLSVYPAVQAQSPTFRILHALSNHPEGLTEYEIVGECADPRALSDRWEELERANLLIQRENSFELTWKGRNLAKLFLFYRSLLGLPVGQG